MCTFHGKTQNYERALSSVRRGRCAGSAQRSQLLLKVLIRRRLTAALLFRVHLLVVYC